MVALSGPAGPPESCVEHAEGKRSARWRPRLVLRRRRKAVDGGRAAAQLDRRRLRHLGGVPRVVQHRERPLQLRHRVGRRGGGVRDAHGRVGGSDGTALAAAARDRRIQP